MLEGMLSLDAGEKVVVLPGVEEVGAALRQFQWPDYVMFVAMLLICMVLGFYYGFCKASMNAQEYFMGGRNMQILPITMSLIARFSIIVFFIGKIMF